MRDLGLPEPAQAASEAASAVGHAIAALMVEHDLERARLRAVITELEEIVRAAGLAPLTTNGAGAQEAYMQRAKAIRAVMDYFGCDGYTLRGLPPELHEAFDPLIVR